ncbi:MAG: InlB B-repeat-containing protein, partial [Anaeroplasmataceae bacterium]|nr:InlB B-repeat-containing protein [Anaeroplasmataceae bacterium]
MQKKITGTICFLMSIIALVFLISCSKSNINGTYYEYSNENYDKSSYFILNGNKWSDDDGASGTFKIDGTSIVFYAKLFGSEEEMMDGTISDGVLVIEIFGTTHTYCLEGKKPSGTTPTPSLEKITVIYDANGGTFSEGENKKTEKVDKNSLLTAPASPTKQNYTFAGWSTNKSESGIWKFASDKVTKDITLYAVWTEAKASILSIDGAKIEDSTILLIVENEID